MSLNYTHIGLRIREIRTLKHISQAELAEEIDMSVSYISHVETAMKKASLETLVRISNAFGITIDQSLEGDHPMAAAVDRWLTWYEKAESRDIQGHPV